MQSFGGGDHAPCSGQRTITAEGVQKIIANQHALSRQLQALDPSHAAQTTQQIQATITMLTIDAAALRTQVLPVCVQLMLKSAQDSTTNIQAIRQEALSAAQATQELSKDARMWHQC